MENVLDACQSQPLLYSDRGDRICNQPNETFGESDAEDPSSFADAFTQSIHQSSFDLLHHPKTVMNTTGEQFVNGLDGVRICYQTFGSATDDAILLLSGGAQSMLSWHEDFIQLLSHPSSPHFVVRYDNRDTGRSTCYPPAADGSSQYTMDELADDALAILDELGIQQAHLVGFSLGGGIAYLIAGKKAPHRVKSLSLLSTTAVGPSPRPGDNVPGIEPELAAKMQAAPIPADWHDRDQVVAFLCYFGRCMAHVAPSAAEEAEDADLARRVFERAEANGTEVRSFFNQGGVAHAPWPRDALRGILCPTIIIHGRHDQNVPLPHAQMLHEDIKGSRLLILDDTAHELPRRNWKTVVDAILSVVHGGR